MAGARLRASVRASTYRGVEGGEYDGKDNGDDDKPRTARRRLKHAQREQRPATLGQPPSEFEGPEYLPSTLPSAPGWRPCSAVTGSPFSDSQPLSGMRVHLRLV